MTAIPSPEQLPPRRPIWQRISPVWLVPIAAVAIALTVAWNNYNSRGPLIVISFENASGIEAGSTALRYRDVVVGTVEDVRFGPALRTVNVSVRLEPGVAPFVDEEAQFWVIRPQIDARGVQGLDTVLSGVYIEGAWDTVPGTQSYRFQGLEAEPVARSDRGGITVRLSSIDGDGLSQGAPILYRGIEVGRVGQPRLSEDGLRVVADAFVEAPHDALVTTATRFWNVSGFRFTLGPQGAELDVASMAALLSGGISFDTIVNNGQAIRNGQLFQLYDAEAAARSSLFSGALAARAARISMIFEGEVSGLAAGATVELGGVEIGRIAAVSGLIDPERFGNSEVRLLATAEINPQRLGISGGDAIQRTYNLLGQEVARGQRARLGVASILTGALKVSIGESDAPLDRPFDPNAAPYPEFPTERYEASGAGLSAEQLLERVASLPVEEIVDEVLSILENTDEFLGDPALQDLPEQAVAILAALRELAEAEEIQAIPGRIDASLAALQTATGEAETLLLSLNEAEAAAALTRALDAAALAADSLPDFLLELDRLAQDLRALPLNEAVTSATAALNGIEAVVTDPAIQAIPADVGRALDAAVAALEDARGAIGTLTEAQAFEALAAALIEAETLTRNAAAASVDLPAIAAGVETTVTAAAAIPFDDLSAEAEAILDDVRALTSAEAVQTLPARLEAAAASLDAVLGEANALIGALDGEALGQDASAALKSLRAAAADVEAATPGLAAIVASAEEVRFAEIGRLLEQIAVDIAAVTSAPATQSLPDDLAALLGRLDATAAAAEETMESLDGPALASALQSALADLSTLAGDLSTAAAGTPALIARIDAIAAEIDALPIAEIGADTSQLLASLSTLASSDEAQALPDQAGAALETLTSALAEVDALLAQIDGARAGADLTAALSNLRALSADAAAAGATLPDLTRQIDAILADAQAVPLDRLAATAEGALADIRRLIGSDAAQAVPPALAGAFTELDAILATLREGGVAENANETLAAASDAARSVADAAAALPDLSRRLQSAAAQAEATLAVLDTDARLYTELEVMLRAVRDAARSVDSLSRTIERNPNALLLGR